MEDALSTLLAFLIIGGVAGVLIYKHYKRRAEEKGRQLKRDERKRLEMCAEVVLYYHNNFGYIAKQVITREELEALIDAGASPLELANIIGENYQEIRVKWQFVHGREGDIVNGTRRQSW